MLAHILAIAVGLSSLVLFFAAFSMSDIHQRDDFLWSGLGLFYALVLWFCASRITGSVLLGQVAAVTLVISFNWQTLKLRKAVANPGQALEKNSFSVTELISGLFNRSEESNPPPSINQVLEEETDIDNPIPEIDDLEQVITEIEPPEEVSSSTTERDDFIEESTTVPNLETDIIVEQETILTEEVIVPTIEEESTTAPNPETEANITAEPETIATEEIIVPTIEEEEQLEAIKESEPINHNHNDLAEEVISVQETTEVDTTGETSSESQAEEINEEKPIDVNFIPSETEENPQPSIDDFLADLDNSIDRPIEDK